MCEFEENILKLLIEERDRLKPFVNKSLPLPYYKSLEHGIESAKEKLKECEYKECVKKFHYKYGRDLVPAYAIPRWNTLWEVFSECKKD
jgi:hypothetical protein